MGGKPRSLRQAQSLLAGQLRARGRTWAEIAAEFRAVYRVNARVALRQAHGWSQPQAAARWTARWPDDPKTFKNFSYWELWPGGTGHAPSLDTLDRLAQLYQCSVTDLLADCGDYGVPQQPRRAAPSSAVTTASAAPVPTAQPTAAQPTAERTPATGRRPNGRWHPAPRRHRRHSPSRQRWRESGQPTSASCMATPGTPRPASGSSTGRCCWRPAAPWPWWPRRRCWRYRAGPPPRTPDHRERTRP